ncbi:MAG: energy transducer TonB, partial [Deltaproteobacteria bacterium]|nr:energy transducer TonB [Kofleriaceae bacterium]
ASAVMTTSTSARASADDDALVRLQLARVKGAWKIASIDLREIEEGGVAGGVVGGVVGGVIAPPPPPPPPPSAPAVPPTMLEAMRVAGEKNIPPDQATRDAMTAAGKTKVVVPIKLCVDAKGVVASTRVLKSSGFPAYDTKLATTIAKTWRYKPYLVNGTPTAICSVVTFIYQQRS